MKKQIILNMETMTSEAKIKVLNCKEFNKNSTNDLSKFDELSWNFFKNDFDLQIDSFKFWTWILWLFLFIRLVWQEEGDNNPIVEVP